MEVVSRPVKRRCVWCNRSHDRGDTPSYFAALTPEKFYKRGSQQKTLHPRPDFCGFPAPLVIKQDLFSLSAPKARDAADNRVALVCFSPCGFHDLIHDEASDL